MADAITEQEWVVLRKLYTKWQDALQRAASIDPDYQDAWIQLSTAATFAGDNSRADSAFWKAYNLNPDSA